MADNLNVLTQDSQDEAIDAALAAVDRAQFVRSSKSRLVAGHSIPTVAAARTLLSELGPGQRTKVLHVGAGSGYLTALLAHAADQVIAIEQMPSMADVAQDRLHDLGLDQVAVRVMDGQYGAPDQAPFEAIVISTPSVPCEPLLEQLCEGGVLLCLEHGRNSLSLLARYTKLPNGECDRQVVEMVDFSTSHNDALSQLGVVPATDPIQADHAASGHVDKLLKRLEPELFNTCSRAFMDHNHIVPIYVEDTTLFLATDDPNTSTVEMEHMFPALDVEKMLLTPADFHRLWAVLDLLREGRDLPDVLEEESSHKDEQRDISVRNGEAQAHLVALLDTLLLDAASERASDIHLERYKQSIRVRLRIDGDLVDVDHYDIRAREFKGLINVIKLRADLNIAERRLPQGGRSRLTVGDETYDLRIQIQPALYGEHVIIRLLPQNSGAIEIDALGFSEQMAGYYRRLLDNPAGLVLVVGPTGSGKSTTLYAGLQRLARDHRRKVITIEDPIEYSIDNVQQVPVRPEIDFNFDDAMRAFVRQDPDVILVGEIRDRATALEAVRAAQTGHVVLSTLHSNDAVDALQRIYDLGIHPNSLASELLAVIAQRLAKRICPHCRVEEEADADILRELFPDGAPGNFRCFVGEGCGQCGNTGTHGRIAVAEYMGVNPAIRNVISKQPPAGELRRLALDCGLITMRDSALDHVLRGEIPLSELPRILPAERMAPEARGLWDTP
jgi:type IV pilus assembly protein PilB